MKDKFTIPKLNKNSKYWYVHYRYEGVQFRETNGLNKIEDLKVREFEYNALCKAILVELKKGWNPNIPDGFQSQNEMYFIESLRFSLEKKKNDISPATYSSYKGTINFFETASKNLKLDKLKITDLKRLHIKMLLEEAKKNRNWTDKAYNTNLLHLQILISILTKWDIIELNPATRIDRKKVDTESSFNAPASEEDIVKIKKTLIEKDYNFYIFSITIFHTGIRISEALKIKLGMINLSKNQFNLPGTITKNKKARSVPINQYLKEYLIKMNFSKLPNDYYLFGSLKKPGKGKKGKENKLLPDFVPSINHVVRKTPTLRWEEIVKDGLGIKMNLYAMKHYGADKKIEAGVDLDSLRELYGHSSYLMTEKYAKVIKEVYRKDIMEKSPDF
jgi:site-specific recombinase XerD